MLQILRVLGVVSETTINIEDDNHRVLLLKGANERQCVYVEDLVKRFGPVYLIFTSKGQVI